MLVFPKDYASFLSEVAYRTPDDGPIYWDISYVWDKMQQAECPCPGSVKRLIESSPKLESNAGDGHLYARTAELMNR